MPSTLLPITLDLKNSIEVIKYYGRTFKKQICKIPSLCWFGDYPTLAALNKHYKTNVAQSWLMNNLTELSEYAGAKDKITKFQLENCADAIYINFYYLKISELMLFFSRFEWGYFGEFYGAVDPLTIITALWDFVRTTRKGVLLQHENELKRQAERERASLQLDWSQYCEKRGITERACPFKKTEKGVIVSDFHRKESNAIAMQTALDIINNTLNLDKEHLDMVKDSFKKYHNCTPEEYLKKEEL